MSGSSGALERENLLTVARVQGRRYDTALPQLQRYGFDADYVNRLTSGDRDTEEHFARYFGTLLTIKLRGRLNSLSLAEDAKQETLLRVMSTLKQKGGLHTAASLGAFVNSVCNNVLFELYRAKSRATLLADDAPEPADEAPGIESQLASAEERDRVHRTIAQLPAKDRNLLTWLFLEERDKDDVCRELKIDRNYLRLLVHRAKGRCKASFNG